MPECYTHGYVASQALMRSGNVVQSYPAFLAGANGPDPFYSYKLWKKEKSPDLPALAKRMHREKTGAFLIALIQLSMTGVQQSYALGFLTHYAADCIIHPYVEAMSEKGKPYGVPNGGLWMQASLDSSLYYRDYKTYKVPVHAGTPVLITEDLAQVTSLLHDAIVQVYGMNIPLVALADTFHNNLSARKFLASGNWFKKSFAWVLEAVLLGKNAKNTRNAIKARLQPAKPLEKLPGEWENPYTHETHKMNWEEILVVAEQTGAACIAAAMNFWLGNINSDQLAAIVGNNNYYTGVPDGMPVWEAQK